MKAGDLVKLKVGEEPRNKREIGTVIQIDAYITSVGMEPMAEVLWNTGETGWILSNRVEVLSESR